MISASVSLQKAIYQTLLNDAGIKQAFGSEQPQIFDKVPDAIMAAFVAGNAQTYITIGEGAEKFELAGDPGDEVRSIELARHTLVFHVWSQKVGLLEAKTIAIAVHDAIAAAFSSGTLEVAGHALINIDPMSMNYDRDRDGFTSHAALVMTALTQPLS